MTPVQLCNGVAAYQGGLISFRALRIYFAAFELVAIREAAERSQRKKGREARKRSFRRQEFEKLTGASLASISRELGALANAGLLRFTSQEVRPLETALPVAHELLQAACSRRSVVRPVPVPRSVLRYLARCSRPTVALASVAYMLRGLSIERRGGRIKSRGTLKCSWLAECFGMSLRAAKAARAELIAVGLISRDEGSHQLKLNRDGAYFVFNVSWSPPSSEARSRSESAPLPAQSCSQSAPPRERHETPYGSKDQRTRRTEPAGVLNKPVLRNVVLADLRHLSRLEVLFRQATACGLIAGLESDALNFVAAACRAREEVEGDPVRVFVAIVRRGLWHHITGAQEDRARTALIRHRGKRPAAFRDEAAQDESRELGRGGQRQERSGAGSPGDVLSSDEVIRQELLEVLRPLRSIQAEAFGRLPHPGDLILLSPSGESWFDNRRNALRPFYEVLEEAEIERHDARGLKLDMHALRHTFASRLARAGVPLQKAQRLLGHSDPKLTAAIYTHLETEDLRDAVDALPALEAAEEVSDASEVGDKSATEVRRPPLPSSRAGPSRRTQRSKSGTPGGIRTHDPRFRKHRLWCPRVTLAVPLGPIRCLRRTRSKVIAR